MIRAAYLTNFAVNGPDRLKAEAVALERRMAGQSVATESSSAALRDARAALEAQRAAMGGA
jgi:hypothetical protein